MLKIKLGSMTNFEMDNKSSFLDDERKYKVCFRIEHRRVEVWSKSKRL